MALIVASAASVCALRFPTPLTVGRTPRHIVRTMVRLSLDPGDSDDLMKELKKALSDVDPKERSASDGRSIDYFVEDKKAQFTSFEEGLARELESVQDNIESRLEGELRGVEADFNARIEAAVDSLKRGAEGGALDPKTSAAGAKAAAEAAAAAAAAADGGVLSPRLPPGALVVVAGASTPLGAQVVRALGGSGNGWKLRALVAEGTNMDAGAARAAPECESVALAPFAPTALSKSLSGAEALVVICAGAAGSGSGGIEPDVVPKLMKAVGPGMRRMLMVSVHGVDRVDRLPFSLQNAFSGALDKQRAAEQEFVLRARKLPGYSILRVGKLKDDAGGLPASAYEGPPTSRAELAAGDSLSGELPMSTAASVLVEALRRDEAVNASFSLGELGSAAKSGIGGESGPTLSSDAAHWDDQFVKLLGPEIYRRRLDALTPGEAQVWLREWARTFLRPGSQLTTPVAVQDTDDGVLLRFLTIATGYADFDVEETQDEKWAATKPENMEAKAGKPDGALLLTAEALPNPRIRVSRAEMADGVVVKEMSETTVLQRLEKDLTSLEKQKKR